jgi:ferredoxin
MKVWIEQEYCTGDGLCEELCPQVFRLADDGLAYVMEDGQVSDAGGKTGIVAVPADLEDDVLSAQAQCAGECIYVER